MAIKPAEGHIGWINDDDTNKYIEPSAAKKLQGWIAEEKPPFQYFNWFWRLVDRWLQWAEAQSDENVAALAAHAAQTDNPHSVTAAQVGVAPSPIYVNAADGGPYMSSDLFDVDAALAQSAWESIGPTGGGANHAWAALDLVPADAHWIEVQIYAAAGIVGGTPNDFHVLSLHQRTAGSSVAANSASMICSCGGYVNANGYGSGRSLDSGIQLPVSSRVFDLRWSSGFTSVNSIHLKLTGCGYNL